MDKIIRWGIIGCGSVTERKSGPAYYKTDGFALQAVMRRDAEKAADYAKRHNVPSFYTDAEALINDPAVDAVYIATPPDTHKHYALMVAKAGKPCCIEKPMAPRYKDCVAICNVFQDMGLPLFVAYYRRSLPRFAKIAEWISSGAIGEVRHISWLLTRTPSAVDVSGQYNWRTDSNIATAGYFDDLASHGLDLFIHLLGDVTDAKGIATNQQGLYTAKDAITASWIHENGATGSASFNFGCHTRRDEAEIMGSKGVIKFSVFNEVSLVLENESWVTEVFIENPENIQLYHVRNIKEHLLGNAVHPSTGVTAAHTAWVMDKILGVL